MGFFHEGSSFYIGVGVTGDLPNQKFFSYFRKLLPNGEVTELHQMPTPKVHFAMALWEERSSLFTLGGWNESREISPGILSL